MFGSYNRTSRAIGIVRRGGPFFEVESLPSEVADAEELLERRAKEWHRKNRAEEARKLIKVKVKMDGPIGIVHFGDPHVDDPARTLFDSNSTLISLTAPKECLGECGDQQNNWVGRLARLYGQQSTSAAEAWVLTEWLVGALPWIYLIGGITICGVVVVIRLNG